MKTKKVLSHSFSLSLSLVMFNTFMIPWPTVLLPRHKITWHEHFSQIFNGKKYIPASGTETTFRQKSDNLIYRFSSRDFPSVGFDLDRLSVAVGASAWLKSQASPVILSNHPTLATGVRSNHLRFESTRTPFWIDRPTLIRRTVTACSCSRSSYGCLRQLPLFLS